MESKVIAWLLLGFGYILPLLHVALSPRGGSWRPPPGSGCPLGPRPGWIVMVLLLGPIGWLMFMTARRRARGRLARHAPGSDGSAEGARREP